MSRHKKKRHRLGAVEPGPLQSTPVVDAPGERVTVARPAFFWFMILIPFLFVGVLEGGLRLAGFGQSLPLWVTADQDGEWLRMNPTVSERWFFGDIEAPGATFDPFRAARRPETFRVVVQGGSSALGFPYFFGGAFSRMLEDHLQHALPDREVEVINTALTAVNSHTLRDIADEIVQIQPDLVLIYAGHNEYYGALGVASRVSGGSNLAVRAWLATREIRLVQAIAAVRDAVTRAPARTAPASRAGRTTMARMVAEHRIPLDSDLLARGEAQLRRNLGDILSTYRRAGIPVLVGTLVSNERDQPPLVSGEPDPGVDWRAIEAATAQALETRDPGPLHALVDGVAVQDRSYGSGFFALGRAFEELGEPVAALEMYVAARDRDELRFRAPSRFNDLIRDVAAANGVTVVESESAFRAASPDGIVGNSLITEHLHPNLTGYTVLEGSFFSAMVSEGLISSEAGRIPYPRSQMPTTPLDSIYGDLVVESLTAGWPFQIDPAIEVLLVSELLDRQPTSLEERLGLDLFRGRMGWHEAQRMVMREYARTGRLEEARRAAAALAIEQALDFVPHAIAGEMALRAGDRASAARWFATAAQLAPPGERVPAEMVRAMKELPSLEEAVAENPTADARYALSSVWAFLSQPDRAIAELDRMMAEFPQDERAQSLKSTLLKELEADPR